MLTKKQNVLISSKYDWPPGGDFVLTFPELKLQKTKEDISIRSHLHKNKIILFIFQFFL